MTDVMNPSRHAPGQPSAPLRTREPRGLIEPADATGRLGGLVGRPLTRVDTSLGRVVLSIAADPVHLLVISGPMHLAGPQGSAHPRAAGQATALLAGWVGRPVTDLGVDAAGGLHVGLGANHLTAPAEADHEAWEVRGMDGGLLVCLPGGRISLWAPTLGRIPRARSARQ